MVQFFPDTNIRHWAEQDSQAIACTIMLQLNIKAKHF